MKRVETRGWHVWGKKGAGVLAEQVAGNKGMQQRVVDMEERRT